MKLITVSHHSPHSLWAIHVMGISQAEWAKGWKTPKYVGGAERERLAKDASGGVPDP